MIKIKWTLGILLLSIGYSAGAQKIKRVRIVSVPIYTTSIARISCKGFDRTFDAYWRREFLITKPEIRKKLEVLLSHCKPTKLDGIDVRGKLIISYCDKGMSNKTICFDGSGHFSKDGTICEDFDLFNFLLHNRFITEGL